MTFDFEDQHVETDVDSRFVDWNIRDGKIALLLPAGGITIDISTSSYVEVEVLTSLYDRIALDAFKENGSLVFSEMSPGEDRELPPREESDTTYTFAVSATDIERLILRGGNNEGLLVQVCTILRDRDIDKCLAD